MKKLFLLAISALMGLSASATDYVVWTASALGADEVQIPVAGWYNWWNTTLNTVDDATAVGGKALEYVNGGNGAAFSYGLHFQNTEFQLSQVVAEDMDLTFNVKSTDTNASYVARLTGAGDCDYAMNFDKDGEWHAMRYHLSDYPALVEAWKQNPTDVVVFGLVADNSTPATGTVSVCDIRFTPADHSGDVVEPTQPETPATLGGTWYGTLDDSFEVNGVTHPIVIDYAFTSNEDGSLTIRAKYDCDFNFTIYHAQLMKHNTGEDSIEEWVEFTKDGDEYVGTSKASYKLGDVFEHIQFHHPFDGGLYQGFVRGFKFGDSNEPTVKEPSIKLAASLGEISSDGAIINYTITPINLECQSYTVTVYNGGDEVATNLGSGATDKFDIFTLDENTSYKLTVTAYATVDGVQYESNAVELIFKTLDPNAKSATWYAISDGLINDCYLPGEDATTDRRQIPMSVETTVTYNTDKTITVNATLHGDGAKIVGLVPKVTISSDTYKTEYQPMSAEGDNKYTFTTTTEYPENHAIGWLFYQMAYAGGATNINVNGYSTGMSNDPVAYGEAASIELLLSSETFAVKGSAFVQAIVKDNAGHYLLDVTPEISIDGSAFSIQGNKVVADGVGQATIIASYNGLKAEKQVVCVTSEDAVRLTDALSNVAFESDYTGSLDAAFDGNENTQIEWNCADSDEHYLTVNLGQMCSVQAVNLVWEGASATEYTVTLSQKAAAKAPKMAGETDADDVVFTVTNGEGGAGVTARKLLYSEAGAVNAQYITLSTTKAYNSGWGIKLKEMDIKGLTSVVGVESVAAENAAAPVEYFNLQGVRVANPENGIYIRRQGNTVTKVFIR